MLMSSSCSANFGLGDDVVGEVEHELGQLVVVERRLAQLFQIRRREHFGVADHLSVS